MKMEEPLVSIGIPAYNRPEGLLRTLECILQQTYRHLEIIVSDNCSPTDAVEKVVEQVKVRDERIHYFRQPQNIGMHSNFKFTLAQATGEFFMWAADDDEWDKRFVEECLKSIGSAASVMSGCAVLYRDGGRREVVAMPQLDPQLGTYVNLKLFCSSMAPGFFYGLHRRGSLRWVLDESPFDWWDCYFVVRQICGGGFITFPEILFTMGIDAKTYQFKPYHPGKGRLFRYLPYLRHTGRAIATSAELSPSEKISLFGITVDYLSRAFLNYEKEARPRQVRLVKSLYRLNERLGRVRSRLGRAFNCAQGRWSDGK